MASLIATELAAIHTYLTTAHANMDPKEYTATVDARMNRFTDNLPNHAGKVSLEDAGECMKLLSTMPGVDAGQRKSIVRLIDEQIDGNIHCGRKVTQDMSFVENFLTEEDWTAILNGTDGVGVERITDRLVRLGVWWASERTVARAATLIICAKNDMAWSQNDMFELVQALKHNLKTKTRRLTGKPQIFEYPRFPREASGAAATTLRAAYGAEAFRCNCVDDVVYPWDSLDLMIVCYT